MPVVTMRDIAAAAGVSQSTVSRVLNDVPTRVPIARRDARARPSCGRAGCGYRPNPFARGLRGAPTMLIGAVVRDFGDPFFAAAIETLAVEAMARGYNVVLGHAHGRLDEDLALPAVLETRHMRCDPPARRHAGPAPAARGPAELAVPVVALWQGSSPLEFPTVDVDNQPGSWPASNTWSALGHERIAFVSGRCRVTTRYVDDAFVEFMTDRFGGVRDGYIQHVPNSLAGGEAALRPCSSCAEPPTAVATSTDLVAVGVLHAAYEPRRSMPDELSVVGFDDILSPPTRCPP